MPLSDGAVAVRQALGISRMIPIELMERCAFFFFLSWCSLHCSLHTREARGQKWMSERPLPVWRQARSELLQLVEYRYKVRPMIAAYPARYWRALSYRYLLQLRAANRAAEKRRQLLYNFFPPTSIHWILHHQA